MTGPRMTPEQARAALATMSEHDFPTVPLDSVYDEDDHPITEASIDRLVEIAHRRPGRPSLTNPGAHSPQITLRLPESVNQRVTALAERTGRRRSQVVRDALDYYLNAA